MTEPKRLLCSKLDKDVWRLLRAGVDWAPAAQEQERIWQSIASHAGVTAVGVAAAIVEGETGHLTAAATKLGFVAGKGAVGLAATTAGAKTATGAAAVTMGVTKVGLSVVALKATAVGVTLGAALLVGGNAVTSQFERRTAAPVSTTTSASVRARISARTEAPAKPSEELPSTQSPTPTNPDSAPDGAAEDSLARRARAGTPRAVSPALQPSASAPPSDLSHQESRFVSMARSALHQGRAADVLQMLRELDQLHPTGVLGEERAVLRIEALARTGERSEATRLAAQFLSRYPSSLHARHVRELIDIR